MRATLATRLTAGIFATVLLLLGVGLVAMGAASIREVRLALVEATAHIGATVATYSAADLAFGAEAESRERLRRLMEVPEIDTVALYDAEGRLFSSHTREGLTHADPVPGVIARSPERSAVAVGGHVEVIEPVVHDGRRYGTLHLRASTEKVVTHVRAVAMTGAAVAGGLLVLAVIVAVALHRVITRPLLRLAEVARSVSTNGDFSVRACQSSGEIGVLADGFNSMLDALEIRERRQAEAEAGQQRYARRLQLIHEAERAVLAGEPLDAVVAATLERVDALLDCVDALVIAREGDTARVLPPGGRPSTTFPMPDPWPTVLSNHGTLSPDDGSLPPWMRDLPIASSSVLIVLPLRAETMLGALVVGLRSEPARDAMEVAMEVAEVLTLAMRQARLAAQIAAHTRTLEQRVSERTAALQATLTELESFGHTVAHDLRAPLRAMQGFATALEEDYSHALDEMGRSHLRRIGAASVRMDMLIRDLLDYTRLVVEPLPALETTVAAVVAEAKHGLEPTVAARGGHIVVVEPLGVVVAHGPTLARMVANLLDNALKFVGEGVCPEVVVSAEILERTVRIRVDDNGVGIDPRHHDRIFGVFEQLDREGSTGTGIGLAIVKKGAERMHGACGVEPRAGGGTRFWIELPRGSSE